MKSALTLLIGVVALALSAVIDRALDITGGIPPVQMAMTHRIWLASGATLLFAGLNYAIAGMALTRGRIATWASALLVLAGAAGIMYLPIWSRGLPGLSTLLSTRSNPMTAILATGGPLSLLKLQCASLLVLGLAGLITQSSRSPAVGNSNAA